jgi:hypothetical protein
LKGRREVMRNRAILFVLALSLVATCPLAQEAALAVEVTGSDELVREKGRFRETWVHPEADFTRYSKLYLWVAELQFRELETDRFHTAGMIHLKSEFGLSAEEQEEYRQVVTEALADELERSKKLELVNDIGPETLIVRASILDIACFVPPRTAGRVDVYLSAVGEGTMRFELIDSETGVMQARVEERSRVLPPGRIMYEVSPIPVFRETMWRDIELWSRKGASDLRRLLEKAQRGQT